MKRLTLAILPAILLASCMTLPAERPLSDFGVTATSEKGSGMADVKVSSVLWHNGGLIAYVGTREPGFFGISVSISNKTDKLLRVNWVKSSVFYGGKSHVPFIDGEKYKDAGSPPPDLIVPASASAETAVYSSSQILYNQGWQLDVIEGDRVSLILCLVSGDSEDIYTVDIQARPQAAES